MATPFEQAQADLHLTPQERNLYESHLANLWGSGGVNNPDGSRSTVLNVTTGIDGKYYVLPTVYDGRILQLDDAVDRAAKLGLDTFPSYASPEEAEQRYEAMHNYMQQDTAEWIRRNRSDLSNSILSR